MSLIPVQFTQMCGASKLLIMFASFVNTDSIIHSQCQTPFLFSRETDITQTLSSLALSGQHSDPVFHWLPLRQLSQYTHWLR